MFVTYIYLFDFLSIKKSISLKVSIIIFLLIFINPAKLTWLANIRNAQKKVQTYATKAIYINNLLGKKVCFEYLKQDYIMLPYPLPYPPGSVNIDDIQSFYNLINNKSFINILPKCLSFKTDNLENNTSNENLKKIKCIDNNSLRSKCTIKYNIENYSNSMLQGWAYIPEIHSNLSTISILLKNKTNCYELSPTLMDRPDVSKYFKSGNLYNHSGFNCNFSIYNIPNGEYLIGIIILNTKSDGIIWTNKYLISTPALKIILNRRNLKNDQI